jgi:tRNA(Arg) A34 adenosine deaminase TadA
MIRENPAPATVIPPQHADEVAMRRALEAARRAGLAGEPPIGACLVRDGNVIGVASNSVISALDITAHAEMNLIRDACRKERSLDLTGCELFSTLEPCPMCFAASHYARIGRIVFAATLEDFHAVTGAAILVRPQAPGGPALSGGCLREESLALLRAWAG